METATDTKSTITVFDRANSWLKRLFFNIAITIRYAFSPVVNKSLHAMLIKICTSIGDPLFHSWHDGIVARKMCPCSPSLIGLNRWKSEGAKSSLKVGVVWQFSQDWQCALRSSDWYGAWCYCVAGDDCLLCPNSGRWNLQFSQCHNVAVRVDDLSRRITHFLSWKTVHITLPTEGCVLNFLFDGEFTWTFVWITTTLSLTEVCAS